MDLDGEGKSDCKTGIDFLDHMLTLFAKHSLFNLEVKAKGDLKVDIHHTNEDVGIVLGEALNKAFPKERLPRRSAPRNDGSEIDAIAVTYGPGLIGSLLVGVETAKTLATVWKKPLVPVNHLLGHFYANWVNKLLAVSHSPLASQKPARNATHSVAGGPKANSQPSLPSAYWFPAAILIWCYFRRKEAPLHLQVTANINIWAAPAMMQPENALTNAPDSLDYPIREGPPLQNLQKKETPRLLIYPGR